MIEHRNSLGPDVGKEFVIKSVFKDYGTDFAC